MQRPPSPMGAASFAKDTMFRKCVAGLLIMLNTVFVSMQNANALKTTIVRQVQKTNAFCNNGTYVKNLGTYKNIAPISIAIKSVLANQCNPIETGLLLNHNPASYTLADANPQSAPTPGTTQKPKSRSRVRLKVIIIVIVVLVGAAIAIGLADRKS